MFQTIIFQSPLTAHFTCVNAVAKIIQYWLLQTLYLKKALSSWKYCRYVSWHHYACYQDWYDQDHQTFVTWLSNHHYIYHHHSAGNSTMGPGPPGKEWLQRRPSKGEKKHAMMVTGITILMVEITIVMVVWFGPLSISWSLLWWCQESHSGF